MSSARCPRAWEAEAVSDGRLGMGERSSFERHAQGCAICRREIAELVALDAAMRELPALESSPFERQRLRSRLLQRVDQELLGTAPRRMQPRSLAIVLASFVFVVGIGVGWAFGLGRPSPHDEAPSASLLPQFKLESSNRASWDDRSVGSVARIVLRSGTVAVQVRHLHAPQRFLLVLPDGELEVHGTRFIVQIDGQRTARVDVSEGVVSLRLEGRAERTLLAGDHWERSEVPTASEPVPSGSGPSASLAVPAPVPVAPVPSGSSLAVAAAEPSRPSTSLPSSALAGASSARAGESRSASSPSAAAARTVSRGARGDTGGGALTAEAARMPSETKADPVKPDPREVPQGSVHDSGFAAGVAAFRRGEYAAAERLLADFTRNAGGDARREDAAFLRAVARSRLGDARGAAELAASYLKSFPNGLRRTEAERLVRAAGGAR